MSKILYAVGAAMAGLISSSAVAAPVTMVCTLTDKDGPSVFDVQVNEDAGVVNYFTRRNQIAATRRAIFTPDMVMFNGFTIDRKDLTFVRQGDSAAGKCEIDTTKRAF